MQPIHANGDNPDNHSLNHPIGVPDALEGEKILSSTKFPSHPSHGPSVPLRGRRPLSSAQRQTFRALGDRPRLWLAGASTAPMTSPSTGLASTPAPPAPAKPSPRPSCEERSHRSSCQQQALYCLRPGVLGAPLQPVSLHVPRGQWALAPRPRLPSHPQQLRVLHQHWGQPPADARGRPVAPAQLRPCCVT